MNLGTGVWEICLLFIWPWATVWLRHVCSVRAVQQLWCSEVSLSLCSLHPGDLYPFTRKPLFIIVDSSNSVAYKVRPLEAVPLVVGYSANP